MKAFTNEQIAAWEATVGKRVYKESGKPFKSASKINTVRGTTMHPKTRQLCYTFVEDDSYVECFRCREHTSEC